MKKEQKEKEKQLKMLEKDLKEDANVVIKKESAENYENEEDVDVNKPKISLFAKEEQVEDEVKPDVDDMETRKLK